MALISPSNSIILDKLPSEVVQLIASSYLPPSSAASLALTSHQARYIVGTKYWNDLNNHGNFTERLRFLELLDQRFSNHILYPDCAIFHTAIFVLNTSNNLSQPRCQLLNGPTPSSWSLSCPWIGPFHKCKHGCSTLQVIKHDFISWRTLYLTKIYAKLGIDYSDEFVLKTVKGNGWIHTRQFRVIDNIVVARIKSTRVIIHTSIGNSLLVDALLFGCEHGASWGLRRMTTIWCHSALDELNRTPLEERISMRKTIELITCPFCSCQATASLTPSPRGDTTYHLEFQRWIDFGALKASDTAAWNQLRECRRNGEDEGRRMMRNLNMLWHQGRDEWIEVQRAFKIHVDADSCWVVRGPE